MSLWNIVVSLPQAEMAMEQSRGAIKELPDNYWSELASSKAQFVSEGDQEAAKAIWVLETIGRAQDTFIRAFAMLRSEEFKAAWDSFDRTDAELGFLERHFVDEQQDFGIEHMNIHVQQFISVFPYRWGISPAFIYKAITCSICGERITVRSKCGHTLGEIYDGEMCVRQIESLEIIHVAIADPPAQRYSVFDLEPGIPGFEPVRFLARALRTPWDGWSVRKEERRTHHPLFKGLEPSDMCGCASGKRYDECCMKSETVFPHFDFRFEHDPPPDTPRIVVRRVPRQ